MDFGLHCAAYLGLCLRRLHGTTASFEDEIRQWMTPERARLVRDLREKHMCTWRALAREVWRQEGMPDFVSVLVMGELEGVDLGSSHAVARVVSGNQLSGVDLCEAASRVLGYDLE